MKFYVLDLDVYTAEDWHRERVEVDAESASRAARMCAVDSNMDEADGAKCTVAVAECDDGRDAEEFVVKLRIEYNYTVSNGKPILIPLPCDDADEEDPS